MYLLTTTGSTVCHPPSPDKRKLFYLFVCRGTLSCYGVGAFSLPIPYGVHLVAPAQFCPFGWYVILARHSPQKSSSRNLKIGFPLSSPPNHTLLPLTHDLTASCISWVQPSEVWALRVPLFHMHPKSACCSCVCRGWSAQSTICSWPFSGFYFLYGLPYSGLGLAWWWVLLFLQPTLLPTTISCHTIPSFLLQSCFASNWVGLFGSTVYSSPNGPARPLVLMLHC